MKKKTARRLTLSRETIGVLGSPDLREALGAYGTMETQCCDTMRQCSVMSCGFTCPSLDQ